MKVKWTIEQERFLKELDFSFNVFGNLSEEMLFEIDDVVTEYLAFDGMDENGAVNAKGRVCESIIEQLAQ